MSGPNRRGGKPQLPSEGLSTPQCRNSRTLRPTPRHRPCPSRLGRPGAFPPAPGTEGLLGRTAPRTWRTVSGTLGRKLGAKSQGGSSLAATEGLGSPGRGVRSSAPAGPQGGSARHCGQRGGGTAPGSPTRLPSQTRVTTAGELTGWPQVIPFVRGPTCLCPSPGTASRPGPGLQGS